MLLLAIYLHIIDMMADDRSGTYIIAPAGTRFLPLFFEVHGGCTGDTAREIRHLLNAWSEQNGYDETRCAVNRHAWRYYIACMLAHAVQAQVRWFAEPMAASG